MNSNEIRAAIIRKGLHQTEVAAMMNINIHSFRKKVCGEVKFSDEQKADLAEILELSPQQLNDWLYDGKLPITGR